MQRAQQRINPGREIGWGRFRKGFPWYNAGEKYPLAAYSEFMPPLRTGINPYDGSVFPWVFREDDPFGWQILEIEEEYQLRPGLENIGGQVQQHLFELGTGTLPVQIAGHQQRNLANNLFWPATLASHQGRLNHERYVMIQPYSLSKPKMTREESAGPSSGGVNKVRKKSSGNRFTNPRRKNFRNPFSCPSCDGSLNMPTEFT
jgi:hypothetical protein